jgi:HupE / UreJ protein
MSSIGETCVRVSAPFVLLTLLLASPALAHKPSDSYLTLHASATATAEGHWDIALQDLDRALTLDRDGDGALTWGEVRQHETALTTHALSRLSLRTPAGAACQLRSTPLQIARHVDGAYARLPLSVLCPGAPATLDLQYDLFFDRDAQHRAIVDAPPRTAILSATSRRVSIAITIAAAATSPASFAAFVVEGAHHIWMGLDHVLFLLALLLPSVLRRTPAGWTPVGALRPVLADVARVVTAFTAAHSLTLALAALGLLRVSPAVIEPAIAASVALAAANNVWPVLGRRAPHSDRWVMALALGLLHGFGFSSVLADVGLPRDRLLSGLVGFNLGVELGQLALVVLFVPLAFLVRATAGYRRLALVGGSLAIAGLAALWFAERTLGVSFIS